MSFTLAVVAGLSLSGCLTRPLGTLANGVGKAAGTKLADATPVPQAATADNVRGGDFCDTASKLGAPLDPTGSPRVAYQFIVAVDEFGATACGWTP